MDRKADSKSGYGIGARMAEDFSFDDIEIIDAADVFGESSAAVTIPDDPDPIFLPSESLTRPDEMSAVGLASRFFERHHKTTRYVGSEESFYNYQNGVWKNEGAIEKVKAQQIVIKDLFERMTAANVEADRVYSLQKNGSQIRLENVELARKQHELLTKFYTATAKSADTSVRQVLNLVAPNITIKASQFDANPDAFNCANGVYELNKQKFREHRPSDLCARQSPVRYDPAAQCPRFLQFLEEIFLKRGELKDFIQRAIGYSISGHVTEQCLFICHGTGANGKSLLFDIINALSGNYAGVSSIEAFTNDKQNGGHTDHLARLCNLRIVLTTETEKTRRMASGFIKRFTGDGRIEASFKFGRSFEFDVVTKMWFAVNHLPEFDDTSPGMARRLRNIPFDAAFKGPNDAITNPAKQFRIEPGLKEKLLAELPGILNWAIEGYRQWQEQGLNPPQIVLDASIAHIASGDRVQMFIDDCLMSHEQRVEIERINAEAQRRAENWIDPATSRVIVGDVYARYRQWCEDGGMTPLIKINLAKELESKGLVKEKAGGQMRWLGYVLRAEE